jgi:polyphosphate kinase
MPRNLFERCEVVFPIRDAQIGARIRKEILAALLADQLKARTLNASGVYQRVSQSEGRKAAFSAQDFFMQVAEGKGSLENIPVVATEKPAEPRKRSRSKSAVGA